MRGAIKWGIVLGVAVSLWTLGVHALGIYTTRLELARPVDIAATVIPIVVLFLALREARDRAPDRRLPVGRGLAVGVLTALVSWPISTAFLLFYHRVINPRWLDLLVAYEERRLRAGGASPTQIASQVERLRASGTLGNEIVGSLVGTLVFGLVLSLVLSLALARRRPGASAPA